MYFKPIAFQQVKCLSLVEMETDGHDSLKYTGCDRAIKQGTLRVEEVSEEGSVNSVVVINTGEDFVFMMDGDVLAGAKQTRVLNTSVFLAPKSKTLIPVSCVERGRWRHVSPKFDSSDFTAPVFMRASKARDVQESLRNREGFSARQGEVWKNVEEYHARMRTSSDTSCLSDMYEQRRADLESFINGFTPSPAANGLVIFVHDRILSMEIFNRRDIYREYFPKILRGVAVEAAALKPREILLAEETALGKITDLLTTLETVEKEIHPGVALGTDKRFTTRAVAGFTLDYNERLVHETALNLLQDFEG